MTQPNKYFDPPVPTVDHPRIRAWRSYRRESKVDHVAVEIKRDHEGLTYHPARIFVEFRDVADAIVRIDEAPWEAELEAWLIETEQAKAVSIDNEKLRFSLLLKPAFRPILIRYGDGYFNSVLIEVLQAGPLATQAEVADVLRSIHRNKPAPGPAKEECRDRIERELVLLASRISVLYQDREVAEDIHAGAIAKYLDERYSVSNSRMLGLV